MDLETKDLCKTSTFRDPQNRYFWDLQNKKMVRLNILNLLLLIAYPLHGLRINSPGARWVRNNVRTQLYSTKEATATVQLAEGEIVKAIITKGQGRKVEAGDILAVEYSAYVQGSNKPFAKGDKEKFTFKDGSMIRGWDISIGSMKVGEKAKFICSSKYGYGEKGVSTVIPPNAKVSAFHHFHCFSVLVLDSLYRSSLKSIC